MCAWLSSLNIYSNGTVGYAKILRYIEVSVPGYCNKVRNIVKCVVIFFFWFSRAYESYIYTTLQCFRCATAFFKKDDIHIFIKNTSLLKIANHYLVIKEPSSLCWWRFLSQCWWLLTEQGSACSILGQLWQFLKTRQD